MLAQLRGQVQADLLGAKARGGHHMRELFHFPGTQARFLLQLAVSAGEGVLPDVVQLAGGNLQRHQVHHYAVLAHQVYVAFAVHGHHSRRALVAHHLAQGGMAVGQAHLHVANVDEYTVKHLFLGQGNLAQVGMIAHSGSPPKHRSLVYSPSGGVPPCGKRKSAGKEQLLTCKNCPAATETAASPSLTA